MNFFSSLGFGLLLLGSWSAWGTLLFSALREPGRPHWAPAAVLGLSLQIAVGGILNLFEIISPAALLTLIFLPYPWLILRLYHARSRFRFLPELDSFLYFGLGAYAFFQYAGAAASRFFMTHDDLHAYLEFPIRALQTGSLNSDPFNVRRLESSLGGMSFIHSLYFSGADPVYANGVDLGLGKILLLGIAGWIAREMKMRRVPKLIFISLTVVSASPWVNITSVVLPEAIFLLLFYETWNLLQIAPSQNSFSWQSAVHTGMIIAGLIAFKSTFLVPGLILGLLLLVLRKKSGAVTAASGLVLLAPWMIAMYRSSGTYFYPLLGRGFHITSYLPAPAFIFSMGVQKSVLEMLQIIFYPEHILLLFFTLYLYIKQKLHYPARASPAFLLSGIVMVSCLAIGAATGFTSVHRYSFSFLYSAVLLLTAVTLASQTTWRELTGGALVAMLAFAVEGRSWLANNRQFLMAFQHGSLNERFILLRSNQDKSAKLYFWDHEQEKLRFLQASVPEGQKIYAHLSFPFLFDFKRNPIFVADFPGGASLPPGMPVFGTPLELAEYFRGRSIFYLMYAYRDHANLTEALVSGLNQKKSLWPEYQMKYTLAVQRNLDELSRLYPKIYDDGENFVVNLK